MDDASARERESIDHTCTRSIGPPKNTRHREVSLINFFIISQCLCFPLGIIVYVLFIRPQITVAPLSVDLLALLVACIVVCVIGVQVLFVRQLRSHLRTPSK